jgi:hypothetical protein
MFGNSLRKSKFAVLPEYKFCLCPENSVYEGYVTEKLFDAYAGLTVPIYSGAVSDGFNSDAFLNYQDYKNMDKFVKEIEAIDYLEASYKRMYEQPLLTKEPSLNEALAFVYNAVRKME